MAVARPGLVGARTVRWLGRDLAPAGIAAALTTGAAVLAVGVVLGARLARART